MLPSGSINPDGSLKVTTIEPQATSSYVGGIAISKDNEIHVTSLVPGGVFANGFQVTNTGKLSIEYGGSKDQYAMGLPFTFSGRLVCQANQPVSPGDAFVGGVRVGPLGGVYVGSAVAGSPVDSVAPSIAGNAWVGQTLTVTPGTWTGDPVITYAYQWRSNGVNILNETGLTYNVQLATAGTTVTCLETATNGVGSASAASNGLNIAGVAVNTVAPVVSGNTAIGSIITSTQGTWNSTPAASYTYEWLANGVVIAGQSGSAYTTVSGDGGKTITSKVYATNPAGTASAASSNGIVMASAFSPVSLFSAGEQGAWYDPSDLSTMFQGRAGTTPVTADGQTVGLILDKSKGLVLGSELVTNGTFDTDISGWTKASGSTDPISWSSGKLRVLNDLNYYASGYTTITGLTIGKSYKVNGVCSSNTVTSKINIVGIGEAESIVSLGGGISTFIFTAIATSHNVSCTNNQNTLNGVSYWDNISVKEIAGNHATAPSDAARPLYKVTGASKWNDFDAIDDNLGVTFPASLGAQCTVARAVVGGAPVFLTAQSIGTSYNINVDNAGWLVIDRALTTQETTDLTAWLLAKGAT